MGYSEGGHVIEEYSDFTAEIDQQERAAKDMARPLVAFWRTLTDAGMHEVTANEVTKLYAAAMFYSAGGE